MNSQADYSELDIKQDVKPDNKIGSLGNSHLSQKQQDLITTDKSKLPNNINYQSIEKSISANDTHSYPEKQKDIQENSIEKEARLEKMLIEKEQELGKIRQ